MLCRHPLQWARWSRTCDLGIKSPFQRVATNCKKLKRPAKSCFLGCNKLQRTEGFGGKPVRAPRPPKRAGLLPLVRDMSFRVRRERAPAAQHALRSFGNDQGRRGNPATARPHGLRHLYPYGGRGQTMGPLEPTSTAAAPIPGTPPPPAPGSTETLTRSSRAYTPHAEQGGRPLIQAAQEHTTVFPQCPPPARPRP